MKIEMTGDKNTIREMQDKVSSMQTTAETLNNKIKYLEGEILKKDKAQEEDKERNKQWDKNYEMLQETNFKKEKMLKGAAEKIQILVD